MFSRPDVLTSTAVRTNAWVVALVFLASPSIASAQLGLSLSWNDCPAAQTATSDLIAACPGPHSEQLILSFSLGQPADSVIALEAVVDVQSAASVLPEWWRYDPDGCRYATLTATGDFFGRSSCADLWGGLQTRGGPPAYYPRAPNGRANQARIIVTVDVLSSLPRSLDAGAQYYAARLEFQNDAVPACPGCDVSTCLVLNSIRLIRVPGAGAGDVSVVTPARPGSNIVTWNGTGANCQAVPIRRHTWGQLKSLYR